MQSSDTSIRPGLAFPMGRERRRGNHAEERVKGTGEVRVRPGTGSWRRLGGRKRRSGARGRRERCAHSQAHGLLHTRRAGRGDRAPWRRLGHGRLGAH